MKNDIYSILQIREVFHLEFLRLFSRKMNTEHYVLKGGVNLRFFFKSIRYSEDMDIDIQQAGVEKVKKVTMDILTSKGFADTLKYFGIREVIAPDVGKAKQTETTQRFKVHLITMAGQDLFTKVEFSRRGLKGGVIVEPIPVEMLRVYKMPPLFVPHYDTATAVGQKVRALAQRTVLQARDIFDLFLLSSQLDVLHRDHVKIDSQDLKTAMDNVFLAEFPLFRDSVVAYLASEEQKVYSSSSSWDQVKLTVFHFLEEFKDADI